MCFKRMKQKMGHFSFWVFPLVLLRISLVILSEVKNPFLPSWKKDEGADSSAYGHRMTRRGALSRSFCGFLLSSRAFLLSF